jgi:tRNA(Ile)-lysidine synthase
MAKKLPLDQRFGPALGELGVEPGAHLLVAVSGGADSVALLHLLRFAVDGLGLRVSAAHFDHAMRPGSASDAAWVAGLCAAWGVPLVSARAGARLGSEEAARVARYAFLEEARAHTGVALIATAHHADDQAETVLFRALRGSGVAGLAGIAPVDPVRRLVRPLLGFRRAELRRYARLHRLRWRQDPSNASADPARNRLRLELLPRIEHTIAPGASAALARLAELAREDEAAWESVMAGEIAALARAEEGALILVRERLSGYDSAVAARLLRGLLRRLGVVPDRDGTRSALRFIRTAPSGRVLMLAGGVRIATEFGEARIERVAPPLLPDAPLVIASERGCGSCRIGGRERRVAWRPAGGEENGGGCAASFALAPDDFPLLLRGRLPGDRVRTPAGTRSLKRMFNDRRVPRGERARVAVLADARGRVLWVPGLARAAPAPAPGAPGITLEITDA